MTIWLDDLLEQIYTSTVLADSGTETGKRLSFIIIDNAVEYLMKAYVESEARIVGPGKAISKKDWDAKKRYFEQVLNFIYGQFSISASKTDILGYHDVRNDLYHQGRPLSVSRNVISGYTKQLKILLRDLHKFQMKDDEWIKKAHEISTLISHEEAISSKTVIKYINQNDSVRFETDLHLDDTVAISHAINAYSNRIGTEPNVDELQKILAMSGHPLERRVIVKRLIHLKNTDKLLKTKRLLTSKAVSDLKKSFVIIS